MSSYVYVKTERDLWTVGFYKPTGRWVSESDHHSKEEAADRVAYLNGTAAVRATLTEIRRLDEALNRKGE